jgi:hypothetical protein
MHHYMDVNVCFNCLRKSFSPFLHDNCVNIDIHKIYEYISIVFTVPSGVTRTGTPQFTGCLHDDNNHDNFDLEDQGILVVLGRVQLFTGAMRPRISWESVAARSPLWHAEPPKKKSNPRL